MTYEEGRTEFPTLDELIDQIRNGEIVIDPDYIRDLLEQTSAQA